MASSGNSFSNESNSHSRSNAPTTPRSSYTGIAASLSSVGSSPQEEVKQAPMEETHNVLFSIIHKGLEYGLSGSSIFMFLRMIKNMIMDPVQGRNQHERLQAIMRIIALPGLPLAVLSYANRRHPRIRRPAANTATEAELKDAALPPQEELKDNSFKIIGMSISFLASWYMLTDHLQSIVDQAALGRAGADDLLILLFLFQVTAQIARVLKRNVESHNQPIMRPAATNNVVFATNVPATLYPRAAEQQSSTSTNNNNNAPRRRRR